MITATDRFVHWASQSALERYDARAHEGLRLRVLLALAGFKLLNFFGGNWDIQWHLTVGRDSLWIPPHLLAGVGFLLGISLSLAAIIYETLLTRNASRPRGALQVGVFSAEPAFLGVFLGYTLNIFFAFLDDQWHRAFGLDSTLWSPPHLLIMLGFSIVDFSLLAGFARAARRNGEDLARPSATLAGFLLAGSFTFEAANFQLSEAFIAGYRTGGSGIEGMLFPILMGTIFPFWMLLIAGLARRLWVLIPIFVLTVVLQYLGTGVAVLGMAILRPVSVVDEFVRNNPGSSIAMARQFAAANGFSPLVGLQQAWIMWLSAVPLAIVALLDRWPAARRRLWPAGPVYGFALAVTCAVWFQQLPAMRAYGIGPAQALLAGALAALGGTVLGRIGLEMAQTSLLTEEGAGPVRNGVTSGR